MKKMILTATLCVTAAITAGCGGSGSMTPGNSSAAKSAISGVVADGYLVGAQVFLDKNRNYLLDAGEPSATTDANGAYTLTVDPGDVGKYPVVAIAIAGKTYDLDDATKTPLQSSYVLSMHALSINPATSGSLTGSVGNFISPISTQLREMMETTKYATVQDATAELRAQLGMPPTANVMENYIANGNSQMHTAARNMASLMGGQMAQVMPGNQVDINRYRSMMGSVFGNISTVRTNMPQVPAMTELKQKIMTTVSAISPVSQGQPFRNFSAAYRPRMGSGMMGGK